MTDKYKQIYSPIKTKGQSIIIRLTLAVFVMRVNYLPLYISL